MVLVTVELGQREAEKERPNENERSCFEVKREMPK